MYFNFEFSYILIPLILILYIFIKKLRKYLMYTLILIATFGIIETAFVKNKIINSSNKLIGNLQFYFTILSHFILYFSLVEYKKYYSPNLICILLFIIINLFVLLVPYWPYNLTKNDFYIINFMCYLPFLLLYYIIN